MIELNEEELETLLNAIDVYRLYLQGLRDQGKVHSAINKSVVGISYAEADKLREMVVAELGFDPNDGGGPEILKTHL